MHPASPMSGSVIYENKDCTYIISFLRNQKLHYTCNDSINIQSNPDKMYVKNKFACIEFLRQRSSLHILEKFKIASFFLYILIPYFKCRKTIKANVSELKLKTYPIP